MDYTNNAGILFQQSAVALRIRLQWSTQIAIAGVFLCGFLLLPVVSFVRRTPIRCWWLSANRYIYCIV